MGHIAKQGIRIMEAICLAAAFLFAILFILYLQSPLQAAHLEMVDNNNVANYDILPGSGAYHGAVIYLEQIDAFECMAGKELEVVKVYQHFHNGDFYQNWAETIDEQGAIEFLSLDPIIYIHPSPEITESLELTSCAVLNGDYDSTIITFAQHISSWGKSLILSFAGEMNGSWAGWSGAKNFGPDCNKTYTETTDLYGYYGCTDSDRVECADGPERYRDMYTHVYGLLSVTNVSWAWVVNHESKS